MQAVVSAACGCLVLADHAIHAEAPLVRLAPCSAAKLCGTCDNLRQSTPSGWRRSCPSASLPPSPCKHNTRISQPEHTFAHVTSPLLAPALKIVPLVLLFQGAQQDEIRPRCAVLRCASGPEFLRMIFDISFPPYFRASSAIKRTRLVFDTPVRQLYAALLVHYSAALPSDAGDTAMKVACSVPIFASRRGGTCTPASPGPQPQPFVVYARLSPLIVCFRSSCSLQAPQQTLSSLNSLFEHKPHLPPPRATPPSYSSTNTSPQSTHVTISC